MRAALANKIIDCVFTMRSKRQFFDVANKMYTKSFIHLPTTKQHAACIQIVCSESKTISMVPWEI